MQTHASIKNANEAWGSKLEKNKCAKDILGIPQAWWLCSSQLLLQLVRQIVGIELQPPRKKKTNYVDQSKGQVAIPTKNFVDWSNLNE